MARGPLRPPMEGKIANSLIFARYGSLDDLAKSQATKGKCGGKKQRGEKRSSWKVYAEKLEKRKQTARNKPITKMGGARGWGSHNSKPSQGAFMVHRREENQKQQTPRRRRLNTPKKRSLKRNSGLHHPERGGKKVKNRNTVPRSRGKIKKKISHKCCEEVKNH